MKHLLAVLLALAALAPARAADDRMARFREAKFGMFIHWGPYSQASVEASWPIMAPKPGGISETEYRALAQTFNPRHFDPQAWVRLARAAGQRYMVFTTKHHDGFCMFDSAFTNYKVTRSPYGKDIAAQLAAACKAEGMPLGFYYSPPDLNHPGYRDTSKLSRENWRGESTRPEWPLYLEYMDMQLRELLTRYGDVFLIWFDGVGESNYDPWRFHKTIHEFQPASLINNRVGLPGDYDTPEQFVPNWVPAKSIKIHLGTSRTQRHPELATLVPEPSDFRPWESCMTINGTWAYNKNDRDFKSAAQIIRTLIEVASRGGNLLLNVGPDPDGVIQPEFEERLRAVGQWLATNGEAIYGTTYGQIQGLPFGRVTTKGGTSYLHILEWPNGGKIELPRVRGRVAGVRLLATGARLPYTQNESVVRIDGPAAAPDPVATVLAIEIR